MIPAGTIKQRALEVGFDLVGIAPPSAAKDLEFLPQWLKKGYGGEMRYLANPRREYLRRVLPSVKSMICVGLIYNTPHPYSTDISGATAKEKTATTKAQSGRGGAGLDFALRLGQGLPQGHARQAGTITDGR